MSKKINPRSLPVGHFMGLASGMRLNLDDDYFSFDPVQEEKSRDEKPLPRCEAKWCRKLVMPGETLCHKHLGVKEPIFVRLFRPQTLR